MSLHLKVCGSPKISKGLLASVILKTSSNLVRMYTHRNKLGSTCDNVKTGFRMYILLFVKLIRN